MAQTTGHNSLFLLYSFVNRVETFFKYGSEGARVKWPEFLVVKLVWKLICQNYEFEIKYLCLWYPGTCTTDVVTRTQCL